MDKKTLLIDKLLRGSVFVKYICVHLCNIHFVGLTLPKFDVGLFIISQEGFIYTCALDIWIFIVVMMIF